MITEDLLPETGCHSTSVKLRLVNPLQVDRWDELLRTHPNATVFHSRGWAEVLAESYGYRPLYLAAADGRRLWALLPLFEVRSWATGRRGVSLPFTDLCPALLSSGFDLQALFDAARELGAGKRWRYLELRGVPRDFAPASVAYYQHDLELSTAETVLFENCDSAMRRAIRKAERAQVQVEVASPEEGIEQYYRLHQLTRQKHGTPPQPVSFFRNIERFLLSKGCGAVLLAKHAERVVAGAIFLHFGEHSVYKFGASDESEQEHRPNNLLLWRGALRMKELGARTLSFGRTSLHQDGLRRFKRGFGATESRLEYCKYDYRCDGFAQEEDDPSTGFHTLFFRHCPKPIARLIGAALYPHVG